MAQPKQKPISKRPSRLASSLLAAKIALGSAVPTPQTSQIRPDEIANRLAADRAQSAGLRSAQTPDDFDEAEEDIPDFEDESAKTALTPDNLTAAQRSQTQQEQQKKNQAASQQQLDAQQQADVAAQMEAGKQRATAQTQQEINKLDQEINKLQEDLTSFRDNISLKKILSYRPNITILINQIIDQLKKKAANLTDEGKIKFYQGVIPLLSMLLGMLRALKIITTFFDAAFFSTASSFRLILFTLPTIILPIIFFILSPIHILFLGAIFYINKIPIIRGPLTKIIDEFAEKVKKQRNSWQSNLEVLQKKVALKKQRQQLENAQNQIQAR